MLFDLTRPPVLNTKVSSESRMVRSLSLNSSPKYQLAKQLKIEQATISKWYKQNYIPETAILIALSEFFEVTIEYLVGFTDKNNYMIPLSI